MNTPQKKPFSHNLIYLFCLTSLSLFSIKSIGEEGILFHIDLENGCIETNISTQMYNMMPNIDAIYSRGRCPQISAAGFKSFGSCKDLSNGEITVYYNTPDVEASYFKVMVMEDCDEWIPLSSN